VDILAIIALLLAGCAAGLLAGYFAIDVGLFLLPLLLVWYSWSHVSGLVAAQLALGTTVIVSGIASIPTIAIDQRDGYVAWKDVLVFAGAGVVGGIAAGFFAVSLTYETLVRFIGVVAFIAGAQLFGQRRKPKDAGSQVTMRPMKLGIYGFISGVFAALTGVANKVVAQRLLYTQLKIPLKRSSGTATASCAVIFLAAGMAFAVGGLGQRSLPPYSLGFLDTLSAIPLGIGATLFTHIGARLGEEHVSRNARLALGLILLAVALKLLIAPQ